MPFPNTLTPKRFFRSFARSVLVYEGLLLKYGIAQNDSATDFRKRHLFNEMRDYRPITVV